MPYLLLNLTADSVLLRISSWAHYRSVTFGVVCMCPVQHRVPPADTTSDHSRYHSVRHQLPAENCAQINGEIIRHHAAFTETRQHGWQVTFDFFVTCSRHMQASCVGPAPLLPVVLCEHMRHAFSVMPVSLCEHMWHTFPVTYSFVWTNVTQLCYL